MPNKELLQRRIEASESSPLKPVSVATVLSAVYLLFGLLYIYFSGKYASGLAENVSQLEFIERYKGYAFILISAAGLFMLTVWLLKRIRQREEAIAEYRHKIVVADQQAMAGLFASSIAHDINNVLMGSDFAVDALQPGKTPSSEQIDILRNANANLKQLTTSLGRVSGRHLADDGAAFDLAALVRETMSIARLHAKLRGCNLEFEGPGSLYFVGRKVLFSQMLLNLLINAGDATGHEGKIMVKLLDEPTGIVLEVHDDGLGIPDEMKETIMQPLYTTKKDGCGLGLLSLDVCAKVHNGRVIIGRSPLGGAVFSVRFPPLQ